MPDRPTSLPWVAGVLWPGARPTDWRGAGVRLAAVPSSHAPRQLLPWHPATLRAVYSRRSDDRSARHAMADAVGAAALLAAAPFSKHRHLMFDAGGESLIEQLRAEVHPSITDAVVLCGPPRANRKPVLQTIDARGRTIAFVKVAWNDLTRSLLTHEAATLERLASRGHPGLEIPRVIATGTHGSSAWLALAPVAIRGACRPDPTLVLSAARHVERTGSPWRGTAAQGPYVRGLISRAEALPLAAPLVSVVRERHGELDQSLGAWHGDFVPWNIHTAVPRTAVWDWERYDPSVPIGFDRLHHRFQTLVHRRGRTPQEAVTALGAAALDLLSELDPAERLATIDWYVAELLTRLERDAMDVPNSDLSTLVTGLARSLGESLGQSHGPSHEQSLEQSHEPWSVT